MSWTYMDIFEIRFKNGEYVQGRATGYGNDFISIKTYTDDKCRIYYKDIDYARNQTKQQTEWYDNNGNIIKSDPEEINEYDYCTWGICCIEDDEYPSNH